MYDSPLPRPHLGLTNGQWGAGKTSKYNCKVNCRCNSFSPFKASEADQDPLVGLKCTTFVPILCKTNFCGFEIEVGKYFFKIYYSRRYAENESYFSYFPTTRQCTFPHQNTTFCFCSPLSKKWKQFWIRKFSRSFFYVPLKRYVPCCVVYWIFRWKGRFFTRNNLWS